MSPQLSVLSCTRSMLTYGTMYAFCQPSGVAEPSIGTAKPSQALWREPLRGGYQLGPIYMQL